MDAVQREPANQAELDKVLNEARGADAAALPPGPAEMGVPPPDDSYRRKLKRVGRGLLLLVSLGVGTYGDPAIGSALADAVEGAAEELAEQLATLLAGRFSTNLGFLALVAAWGDKALTNQIAKLHAAPKRPDNVQDLHPQNEGSQS